MAEIKCFIGKVIASLSFCIFFSVGLNYSAFSATHNHEVNHSGSDVSISFSHWTPKSSHMNSFGPLWLSIFMLGALKNNFRLCRVFVEFCHSWLNEFLFTRLALCLLAQQTPCLCETNVDYIYSSCPASFCFWSFFCQFIPVFCSGHVWKADVSEDQVIEWSMASLLNFIWKSLSLLLVLRNQSEF